MKSSMLLAVIWILVLNFTGSASADIAVYIEAESATEFLPPMAVFEDDLNAWGKYIKSPNRSAGYARYEIEMTVPGTFYIWGRAKSEDDGTNSFHFKLNDAENLEEFIWDIPEELPEAFCPNWCWDLITNRPGEEAFKFDFNNGKNDLYIIAREENTGLDALYIVSSPNIEPPNEPLVEGGQGVLPDSKLAETWAKVKKEALMR